jgi:hypothetical protein
MVTKQNLTGLLAQTGQINNSDKFAAEGLTTIVNDISNLFYSGPGALTSIKADVISNFITRDTYISYATMGIEIDTAENILLRNSVVI